MTTVRHRPHQATRGRALPPACRAGLLGLAWVGLAWVGAAQATALAGGPGSPAGEARRTAVAAPTAGADAPTLDLATGRIDAVAADGSSISLQGRTVPLHPERLLVLGSGGQRFNTARALRPGMQVRFALDPALHPPAPAAASAVAARPALRPAGAEAARRIVLIYIDATP